MKGITPLCALAMCVSLVSTSSIAQPTVLLRDSFDANTGNTFDLNVDLARQSGPLAPVPYTMAFGPGHYGHQLQNGNAVNQLLLADFPNSTVSPNVNFNGANSAGGLKISFDLDSVPLIYGDDPGNWGCINIGMAAADQMVNVNGGQNHFGILFRGTGTIQAFLGGAVVSPSPEPVYTTNPRGVTNHIDILFTDVDGNAFDGVGNTIIEVFVNGGGLPVYTYVKAGGFTDNYINLQGSFRAHFDNLTISRLPSDLSPVVVNPSFEADTFTAWPGYVSANVPITGWNALGGHGINPVAPFGAGDHPFADNGTIPDGRQVVFLQQAGPLSQVVSGFRIGGTYEVRYFENARNCCGAFPGAEVKMGGQTVVDAHLVTPVGGSNPYREIISRSFVATASAMQLEIIKSDAQAGDSTLVIDNVSIVSPATPVSIISQPQDTVGILGSSATFSVVALGSDPISYQWYFGDLDIPGATGPTLTVPVQSADAGGEYYVVVQNPFGTATSRRAVLTVRGPVPGLFDTGVDDTGTALPDGAFDPHYKLIVNADSASSDAIVHDSTIFPIVSGPWLANTTRSKWIGPRFDTAGAAGLAQGNGTYVYRLEFDLTGVDVATVIITGGWAVDNLGLAIRVNDVDTGIVNNNGFAGATDFTLSPANASFVDGLNTLDFVVQNVDAVAGYTGLRVVNLKGQSALPGTPPSISGQPQSQTVGTGESVSLSVVAAGSSPLTYQWSRNGTPLTGQTGPTLTIASATHADAGTYVVVVTNPYGTATSADAVLTVRDSVTTLFNTGVDDTRAALPDGAADSHYVLIVNPDGPATAPIVEDSTVFPIVTGPWVANSTSSKWIGPRFETSGAAGAPDAGGDYVYRLSVDLTGFDPASVVITGLWATDNAGLDILVNGRSSGNVNSAQFTSLTPFTLSSGFVHGINLIDFKLNNSAVGYTGLRVQQLRGLGTALPPGTPPFIVENPQSYQATVGDRVVLSVRANGSPPLSYQWYFGPDPLPGETGPSLTLQLDFPDQAGDYSVEVSNDFGVVTSQPARVEVSQTPRIDRQPQSQLVAPGEPAAFSVAVSGEPPFGYQWYRNNQPIPGATEPTLALASVADADAGAYFVRVSNAYGEADSALAILTVTQPVPGLFNTGVDDAGNALSDGAVDPHYVFSQNPDSAATAALVQDSTVFPIVTGPWLANNAGSKWIGPRLETSAAAGGDYTYRLTFNLAGVDPATVRLTGGWATDNAGLDILVNGVSSGQANSVQFVSLTPFTLTRGFAAGVNTIDFKVNNASAGYTGLRIEGIRALAAPLTNVNHAPSFKLAGLTFPSDEDAGPVSSDGWAFEISAGPWYEAGQTLTFLVTCDNPVLFSSPPALDAAGKLTFTSAPNAHGETLVTVVLQDNGGTANGGADASAPQTFRIVVRPMNDCPVSSGGSLMVDQDAAGSGQLVAADVDGDALTFVISQPPAHGGVSVQALTGAFSYAPASGYCGPDSFAFVAVDAAGCRSAESAVSITVNCLNQPPECEAKIWPEDCALRFPGQSGLYALALDGEKACLVLAGAGSDPDGDPLQFSWAWDGANTAGTAWLTNCFDLGCHTATLTVSDGRATCSSVVEFCVITAGEAVEQCVALVNGANLGTKNKRPLIASLKAAGASFDRGSLESAVNQLKAFQNKVRAQVAPRWPAEAAAFTRCTQQILDAVDCAAAQSGQ